MRLGKRERALKRAIVNANLSTPKPVVFGKLTSCIAPERLMLGTHTGFRDPKGNLTKGGCTITRVAPKRWGQ